MHYQLDNYTFGIGSKDKFQLLRKDIPVGLFPYDSPDKFLRFQMDIVLVNNMTLAHLNNTKTHYFKWH